MAGIVKVVLVSLTASVAVGCGGSNSSSSSAPGFFITISNLSFSPLSLRAPPGATVTVINNDSMAHSVTSQATSGSFTPGAVAGISFDTGAFTGQRTFTLPSSAANGTVIPYFCTVHRNTMATPNGQITIDSTAVPSSPPGGGGGGGY
jgi:plastocyanin